MIGTRASRITSVILLLFAFGIAQAQSRSDDIHALLFRENMEKAERGDMQAQEEVAFAYMYGLGVSRDDNAAIRWYEKAASAGSALAMSELGGLFGLRKDYARAFEWYSRASEKRYPFAVFRLGVMYEQGWHVAKDGTKATRLFEDAAWLGSAEAQHYLGLLYFQGQLVPKSFTWSYAWLNLAASKNSTYAKARDLVEKRLTPEQLGEAQRLSTEWAEKLKHSSK